MVQTSPQENPPDKTPPAKHGAPGNRLAALLWLPIPVLLIALAALWVTDPQTAYESPLLLMAFNFLFSTASSLLVVVLLGRSFLVRGSPGLLLLGCGVAIWGAAGTLVPVLFRHGTNALISGHNSLVWFAALFNLTGALLTLRSSRPSRLTGLTLAIANAGALCLVWLVALLAVEGWMPTFFVQGQGGTPLRTFVLGSAVVMFVFAAVILWRANRPSPSAFSRWYGAALLLVATGLLGIMVESVHGGALSWTARAAQFLGGAYMLLAAIASLHENRTWELPLTAALADARQQYRTLFETMSEGFALHEIMTDDQGHPCDYRFLDVNPAFERLTGLKRCDIVGKRVLEVMPDTDRHWIEDYGRVVVTGEPLHMEDHSAPLGRWYEVFAYRTASRQFAVVFSDITQRKRTEEALQESHRQFAVLTRNIDVGVALINENGEFAIVNPEFLRLFELASDSSIRNVNDRDWGQWQVLAQNGKVLDVDEHPVRKATISGKPVRNLLVAVKAPSHTDVKWMEISAEPFVNQDGRMTALICTYHDVTARIRAEEEQRKKAEDALRLSESEFYSLAEAMPQIVWATRPDGWNIYFNQQWVHYTGMSMEESHGQGWIKPFHPDDKQRAWEAWQRATQRNEPYSLECRLRRADGVYRWWLIRGSPMRAQNGEILKWFGTCTDIEDIKNAENRLRATNNLLEQRVAERTAALQESENRERERAEDLQRSNKDLEQFAYVASHDLQEPLRMVTAFAGLLKDRYQGKFDATGNQYIDFAVEGATRMSQLIQDLLAYSRAGAPTQAPATTPAEVALAEALANLRSSIEEQHATITSDPLPVVMADAPRLTLTLQNVISNAIKFQHKGVQPAIHVGAKRDGRNWVFSVKDNGIGIPRDQCERIFEVFQRLHTRDEYTGTGIGLAICKRTVERQGGRIWVESEPSKGSTFKFTIPAVAEDTSATKTCW